MYKHLTYRQKLLIFFFAYLVTGIAGIRSGAVSGFETLFWFPSGIAVAALILFGYRFWPVVPVAAFLVNFLTGAPFGLTLVIALGNTAEAILAVYLLRRVVDFRSNLLRLIDAAGLTFLAALVATTISATVGTTALWMGGFLSADLASTWITWWVGDMVSILVVAPFLLTWSTLPDKTFYARRLGELVVLSAAVLATGIFVFRGPFGTRLENAPFTYLVFPPLIWAAVRFGPRETATATFILTLLAIISTTQGYGPFAIVPLQDSLLFLQIFIGITAITFLILSAAVGERRELEIRKDNFISLASHELKTPITSIKALTQVLEKTLANTQSSAALQYLERLELQLDKLVLLINDMLDASRTQVGKIELTREHFLLQALVKEAVIVARGSTDREIIFKSNELPQVFADRDRVSQVISNLLANALRYSPRKNEVVVRMGMLPGFAVVSIRDFGKGIAKRHQARIFSRFYRPRDDGRSGLGIGLYLSKVIVEQHGGQIWVKSAPGRGSTFSFSLPLA